MPTVPVPRVTGQTVAEAPMPGVRISGGNPDFGQSIGGAIATAGVRAVAYEAKKEADTDALKYSIEGRDALDALHMKAMTPVELPDGSLDYAGPLKDYEAQAQKIIRTVSGQAKHPLAQRATLDSLSSYAQAQRGKLATIAREQAQKNAQAIAMNRADAVLRDGTLSAEERRNELLIAAKQFQVATGDPVEALKFFEKATRDGATFDWLSRVNVAESESDLDGLMQNLQTEGRALGPQGALQIRAEIDRKRESMVKAQNAARKADEESADKMLTDLSARGQITPAIVETMRPRLSADAYRRWAGEPDKVSQRVAEGVDDPDIYRKIQGDVIAASKNIPALERLRGRIRDYMTGYDPTTRQIGKPALSRDTALRLLNQAEEYINAQKRDAKDAAGGSAASKEQSLSSKRAEVESQVRGYFKRYVETRGTDRDAAKSAQDREFQAMEGLLKDGSKDPLAWFEQWKKSNDDIIRARTALPSFVPRKADGAPDFGTARAKLAEDFRQKRGGPGGRAMTQAEYDARFRAIQKLEQEYAK